MTKEETENGGEDMLIDGPETQDKELEAFPERIKLYYGWLFPHADMSKWMSYGNDGKHPACDQSYFGRREYSFTLENDIYMRFQSYKSASELEKAIKITVHSKLILPAKRHAYSQSGDNIFTPVEKELVFDIDISDYDDVRYCCSGADVCLGMLASDGPLQLNGRRGVHCWVCDTKARRLNNEQRSAIAEYFRVYKGNSNSKSKVSLVGPALHPFLVRSYNVLSDYFEKKLLCSQQLLSDERYENILDMISDESVASELRGKWQGNRRSNANDINIVRWEQLKQHCGRKKTSGLRRCLEEIVFSTLILGLIWRSVSKHMNHLLKSPFCVHPKTGRVCIPINPNLCDEFDPTNVPTLSKLLREINTGGLQAEGEKVWDRTSMGKSIRYFKESFLQPLLKSCKEEMEASYNAKNQQLKNSLGW
ncbi:putative DNA primase, small subunit [Helianthus annuus]|nr:putative DNA primase, small subunit [Helianthus annuus]